MSKHVGSAKDMLAGFFLRCECRFNVSLRASEISLRIFDAWLILDNGNVIPNMVYGVYFRLNVR